MRARLIERALRVGAVVLAAGRSSRMAPHNKLLLRDESGRAMVARVAAACAASRAGPIVVVTGHQAAQVMQAVQSGLGTGRLHFAHAPDYAAGLSASLRAGVRAMPPSLDGAVVCLGDMPLVGGDTIDRMIDAFDPASGTLAVVPVWQDRRGNPVLWNRRMFGELCSLQGDAGGKTLLASYRQHVLTVQADGPGVLTDYDSPAVLPACWRADSGGHS